VLSASNGKEAIELCIKHKPALTLLDIQMPEMDGTQALKKLRALGCNKPIYALTANAMSHEIIEYLAMGFDGHLKKPIERETFLSTIDRYYSEQVVTEEEMGNSLDDFDMADLRQSFIANLSQDRLDILKYDDVKDKHHLARAAHKIAGAAKMFGFAELSQSALELEHGVNVKGSDAIEDLVHCLVDEISLIQYTDKNSNNANE
jgi:CheY-like chemotaxis protein/HPt (histidine-containing phosphotransfer) domain-containing protein